MAEELKAFKREERYLVIKYSDLNKVPPEYRLPFMEYLDDVNAAIPSREFVVVESDWPEYEKVWAMIEARVNGSGQPTKSGEPVEVVGYLETRGRYSGQIFMTEVDGSEPLMTVAQHQRILAAATHPADQVAEGVRLDGLVLANQQMGRIYLHFKTTEQQHVALRELRAILAKP